MDGCRMPVVIAGMLRACNIYICGRVSTVSDGYDMKVMRLDADLNIDYNVNFDGYGEDDMANALDLDEDKNAYLTGYYTNLNNNKVLVVMKPAIHQQAPAKSWKFMIWKLVKPLRSLVPAYLGMNRNGAGTGG